MGKLTKNQKLAAEKIEAGKAYSLKEAAQLVKDITFSKFDASLDIDVRLGVDPRKANQMVRGVVSLPHGTGKQVRVLVLCTPDAEAAAKEAGADYVGLDEYIEKIKGGWTDIDVIITYYTDKSFDFVIKTPPVAIQLLELAKIKSGSAEPNRKKVAEITWEQVRTIAQDKMVDLNCFTIESAMTMVAGTARSMGIAVKGEFPGNN